MQQNGQKEKKIWLKWKTIENRLPDLSWVPNGVSGEHCWTAAGHHSMPLEGQRSTTKSLNFLFLFE